MEISAKIVGLEDAMAAMAAAFPRNPEQQRRILNQTLSGAARPTIVKVAKELALRGDSSGALSESIKPRAVSKRNAYARGVTASVHITPVRHDRKAMTKYIQYYHPSGASSKLTITGIRHGHLIEWGHRSRNGGFVSAKPFLRPAKDTQYRAFIKLFANIMRRKVEAAVRRRARKRGRR